MSSDRRDDRGRDRGRDRGGGRPHDTNKNDARSIRCRVFIGNLNTDSLSRQELEDIFAKHGRVTGCSLHNGFGFVQYEKESDADEAVTKEHGTIIKGRRVDVNLAGDRRKPDEKDKRRGPPSRGRGRGRTGGLDRPRERSPSPPVRRGMDEPFGGPGYRESRDRFRDDSHLKDPLDWPDRSPMGPPLKRSPYGSSRDTYRRPEEPYQRPDEVPPKRMKPDYDYPPPSREPLPYPKPVEAPIDCEIIIINKQQRGYAEVVEKKLKAHGLVVECAHLPETVTLLDELEDASRRGVLYGIIISSQHEVHHSVTVHILHGTQQEHRNMPLEDAISLVSRNFEIYMQNLREREQDREPERPVSMEPVQPAKGYGPRNPQSNTAPVLYSPEIAQLLNMAADGKPLTANQYTQLINEFTKLRDELLKQEGRSVPISSGSTAKTFPTDPQSIALQQAELQAKILSILNPSGVSKSILDNKSVASNNTNSLPPQTAQMKPSPDAEAKPVTKIPVLTPSYTASTPFKAPTSTVSPQSVTSQSRSSGSQFANNILGMALSKIRGVAGQSTSTNQLQSSVSYAQSSPYPTPPGSSTVRTVQPQARSQAQYRDSSVTSVTQATMSIPSTAQSYGARGQFMNTTNTGYRPALPNNYPGRY